MMVWFPGASARRVGLCLEPGWNEVPEEAGRILIERGLVTLEADQDVEAARAKIKHNTRQGDMLRAAISETERLDNGPQVDAEDSDGDGDDEDEGAIDS